MGKTIAGYGVKTSIAARWSCKMLKKIRKQKIDDCTVCVRANRAASWLQGRFGLTQRQKWAMERHIAGLQQSYPELYHLLEAYDAEA